MARGFSETEKQMIKQRLIEVGREHFIQFGLKKTGIRELTSAVGISQGAFYLFYRSKEELFFELLMQEESRIRSSLFETGWHKQRLTKQAFKQFILNSLKLIDDNPLIKTLFLSENFEQLWRSLPEEVKEEHEQQDEELILSIINFWYQQGWIKRTQPQALGLTIRSLIIFYMHKEEIGGNHQAVFELMVDALANHVVEEA